MLRGDEEFIRVFSLKGETMSQGREFVWNVERGVVISMDEGNK